MSMSRGRVLLIAVLAILVVVIFFFGDDIGHAIYSFSTSERQDIEGTPVPVWLAVTGAVVAPVGAIATAIGVIAALYVATRDTKRFRDERRQQHAEENARRADQARLIQVTVEEQGDNLNGVDITSVHIHVTNHSDRPILDVSPCLNNYKDRLTNKEPVGLVPTQLQMLHPSASKKWAYTLDPVAETAPDQGLVDEFGFDPGFDFSGDLWLEIGVEFTDAKGVKWERGELGAPRLRT